MTKHVPVIDQITAYLKATETPPTVFGRKLFRDPHFVGRLLGNRTAARIDKALAYIADNPPKRKKGEK